MDDDKKMKIEIEDKIRKIEENQHNLNEKSNNVNTLLNSLNTVQKALDDAMEEYEKFNKQYMDSIIQLKEYIFKHEDEFNNFDKDTLINQLDEYINKMQIIEAAAKEAAAKEAAAQGGGKRKSKGNSKKVAKKPVASQKKQSIYKEILGKQMKIYKMPDSRKEYVKYKGDLHLITDYKSLIMKQKANAKQKAIAKTKTKK